MTNVVQTLKKQITGVRIGLMFAKALERANASDGMAMQRLLSERAAMTGGRGFRVPPKEPAVRMNGKTRGEMKSRARQAANDRVSENRAPIFQHLHGRVSDAGKHRRAGQ